MVAGPKVLCYDGIMDGMTRTTILLPTRELDTLRELANELGYVSASGPRSGEGSVTGLMAAIARGDLVVRTPEPKLDGQDLAETMRQLSLWAEQLSRALQESVPIG